MKTQRTKPGSASVSSRRSARARWALLGLAVGFGLSGCTDPSGNTAADGPITAENLPLRDDYWPQKVHLTKSWAPESGEAVRPIGVLVRVESPELARIDFGHQGIHEVPIGVTDLVERANELREQGPGSKIGNVTRMIGGALGDPRSEVWQPYPRSEVAGQDFLLVAAPLDAALLREMAEPLARVDAMNGVRVIYMAQGDTTTEEILRVLHEIGWTTPFLRQRFVRAATDGYLGEELTLPWLGLLTPNGRVLHQGPWPPDGDLQEVVDVLAAQKREHNSRAIPTAGRSADDGRPA